MKVETLNEFGLAGDLHMDKIVLSSATSMDVDFNAWKILGANSGKHVVAMFPVFNNQLASENLATGVFATNANYSLFILYNKVKIHNS